MLVLFPFAAPLIKLIAHHFPDKGLMRVRQGRQVVIDIVKRLMAERRLDIEHEQARLCGASCASVRMRCLDFADMKPGKDVQSKLQHR